MSFSLTDSQKREISKVLYDVVRRCDLDALALVTRTGFEIEFYSQLETDSELFSSLAASVDSTGSLVCQKMNQGDLIEIVIWASNGYTILCPVSNEYILIGASREMFSLGKTSLILRNHAEQLPSKLMTN